MGRTFKRYAVILCLLCFLSMVVGVKADWVYYLDVYDRSQDIDITIREFTYMPEGEAALVQRLSDILNQKYTIDGIPDARAYLIDETIQVRWQEGAAPYVGSMDANYREQIDNLFGNILLDSSMSFMLKNQDLNWDGYTEIAMYTTSDPLSATGEWPVGAVCVYITVFTPYLDGEGNIAGYNMVCDSLRGFCGQVRYGQDDLTPSFSTDHWRDDIGYWYYDEETWASYVVPVPADAMSLDGTKPFRLDFNSYNSYYQYGPAHWGNTTPHGRTLIECVNGLIPWLDGYWG